MDELNHHGIKGMKWGVRRYQKPNGKLTPAGKKREKLTRKQRIARAKKGMSAANFKEYRKGGLIPNDMRAVRVYERAKRKNISYSRSSMREGIRDLAGIEAYVAAWSLYYTAPFLKAIIHNKAAHARYNRGKQYAQRNLARIPDATSAYEWVASVGGVDILEKFKP